MDTSDFFILILTGKLKFLFHIVFGIVLLMRLSGLVAREYVFVIKWACVLPLNGSVCCLQVVQGEPLQEYFVYYPAMESH